MEVTNICKCMVIVHSRCVDNFELHIIVFQSLNLTEKRTKTSWGYAKKSYKTNVGFNSARMQPRACLDRWPYQTIPTYLWAGISMRRLVLFPATHTWPFIIVLCKWSSVKRLWSKKKNKKTEEKVKNEYLSISASLCFSTAIFFKKLQSQSQLSQSLTLHLYT